MTRLYFSGNDGIGIHEELTKGVSGKCETFDNPPLAQGGYFEIDQLEVFGFCLDEE